MPKPAPAAKPAIGDVRLPRAEIARTITEALATYRCETGVSWGAPPGGCHCGEPGIPCTLLAANHGSGGVVLGGDPDVVPLSPDQSVTAADLIAAMPAPDNGDDRITLGQAWSAFGELVYARLGWCEYRMTTIGQKLARPLAELASVPATADPDEPPPGYLEKHCQGCGARFTAKRESAKWCAPACRQRHWMQRQKAANG
jgi:hypothetical protein